MEQRFKQTKVYQEAPYTNLSAVVGIWNVSVIASNVNGTDMQTWIWNVTAEVLNQPPIANFTFTPKNPIINESATFNATNSTDPDGIITNFTWNFGDKNITTTTDPTIIHSYTSEGTYTVTLTIEDNDGATDTTTTQITVLRPEGGVAVAVHPKISYPTPGTSVNINITVVSQENFNDSFHVYLTTDGVPEDKKANLTWFNWTDTNVDIQARGEAEIPLKADIPEGESGTKAFKVVVESKRWMTEAFDMGIFEI